MKDRIHDAFESVHAEDELKEKTLSFLSYAGNVQAAARKKRTVRRLVPLLACVLLLFIGLGGSKLYFSTEFVISIDVNPSFEIGVNKFDRVVSVTGYNDDGENLVETLDIKNMDYRKALDKIFTGGVLAEYYARNEVVTVTVVGSDEPVDNSIIEDVQSCTGNYKNTYCQAVDIESVDKAHELGLSYGKYAAFLELQALDPSVTAQDIQGMTMREIRELIYELSGDSSYTPGNGDGQGQGNGQGDGSGQGQGYGPGNGMGQGQGDSNGNGDGTGQGNGYGKN